MCLSTSAPLETTSAPFEILKLLKSATADIHQKIEEHVPVFDADFDLAKYTRLLERFYGFWKPVETRLLRVDGLNDPALGLSTRMKTGVLEADLHFLGIDSGSVACCEELPLIDSFAAGVGCLYVLEGSTLGGRIISRRLASHLSVKADSGGGFFNAYGEAVGQRWKEFQAFVTAHVTVRESNEVVDSAVETFEKLGRWLCR